MPSTASGGAIMALPSVAVPASLGGLPPQLGRGAVVLRTACARPAAVGLRSRTRLRSRLRRRARGAGEVAVAPLAAPPWLATAIGAATGALQQRPAFAGLALAVSALAVLATRTDGVDPHFAELLLAGLAGWTAARLASRKRSQPLGALDRVAGLAQSAQSAAVVYELTAGGVMDALPFGPPGLTASELARRCGMGTGRELSRLLHHLALEGIVREDHSGRGSLFCHSAWSKDLACGGEARNQALVHLSPEQLRPWWRLREALSGGADCEPFRLEHGGRSVFEFYTDPANAPAARHFDALMRELSMDASVSAPARSVAELAADLPLWSEVVEEAVGLLPPTVVDVGGGQGHMLAAVLSRQPRLHGVLFDRPDVVAARSISPSLQGDLAHRTSSTGGNFFAADGSSLPGAADVFMLKAILHDWSDAKCRSILRCLRSAIERAEQQRARGLSTGNRPRILLLEATRPEDADDSEAAAAERARSTDAYMWVVYGGRERTVAEYAALLSSEGFAVDRVTNLDGFHLVAIEAKPAWPVAQSAREEVQVAEPARRVPLPVG